MRIAYVLPFPELNGGNKVIAQHAGLLAALGHRTTVVADGARPAWFDAAAGARGAELAWIDASLGPPRLPAQDLVVATYWTTIARAAELAAGPLAHFCQGYEGGLAHLAPVLAEIESAYARPLPTLTVSPHLAELVGRRFGRAARVVPPPLDPLFRPRPRRRPRRRPWVAVPGIFPAPVKDVPTALAALRRLREGGVAARLLRISTWPLEEAERRLLLPDRYLHGVSPAEVARALRGCDLLLFPSRAEEGFGLPVLEAMAAGVPVVASRIPSVEGFAAEAAALVPPGDDLAFAEAAAALLADPARWRRARRAGRRAARRFAADEVAPLLDAAVRWAAEAAGGARGGAGMLPLDAAVGARPAAPAPTASQPPIPAPTPAEPMTAEPTNPAPPLRLHADPEALAPGYAGAEPFPHAVIDGLFDEAVLDGVLAEFPRPDEIRWDRFDSPTEKKLGYSYRSSLGPRLEGFLWRMSSAPVLEFLERLTGIDGLIPDPYFGGAGPHQIEPGGFLKVHADFNWHPKLRLDRRLNLLVYLNRDWQEEYGGHLELWDRDVIRCVERVLPVFNRTVVFSTTDFSFHGHPTPLACPPGRTRKSVSFYYYSNGRPAEERSAPHDTIFKPTPPAG